jgi:hypothetical protein
MAYDCVGSNVNELYNTTRRLSSGSVGESWLAKNIEAATNGILETFMNGKVINDASGTLTYKQLAQPTSAGISLMMTPAGFTIYTSDGTGSASCGIIDAEAAAEYRGIFRMVLRDVDGAQGIGFHQFNVLAVPSKTSFEVNFDISSWTHRGYPVGVAFAEFGVMGAQGTAANIADATKEPGDGNPFIMLQLVGDKATPRVRFAGSGAAITTGMPIALNAAIVSGAVSTTISAQQILTIVYTYDNRGSGAATISFKLNGADVSAPISGVVAGPFQVFGRVCHGATYEAAGTRADVPVILDLDTVQLINPRYRA